MSSTRMTSALLGATALGFAFAAPASAQTTEANACDALTQMIEEAGDSVSPDFADAAEVAEMSDGNACLLYVNRVDEAGGMTALTPTEGGGAATAQGETGQGGTQADVQAIDSDQQTTGEDGAQSGAQSTAQSTDQNAAQQDSSQSGQTATSDQGGTQDTAQTTEQTTEQTAGQESTAQQATAKGTTQEESAEQTADQGTGQQDTAESSAAQQDTAQSTSGDDTAQQSTTDQSTGQSTDQSTGQQEATDSSAAQQDTAQQDTAQQDTAGQAAAESPDQPAANAEAEPEADVGTEVAVADITGRGVVTAEGEDIGEIDRILVIDGEPYAIFERGGFLGFGGEEVAIPAAQLEMRGEELILTGIGTDDFEAMPGFEAEAESELASEDMVRIGAAE